MPKQGYRRNKIAPIVHAARIQSLIEQGESMSYIHNLLKEEGVVTCGYKQFLKHYHAARGQKNINAPTYKTEPKTMTPTAADPSEEQSEKPPKKQYTPVRVTVGTGSRYKPRGKAEDYI